MLYFTPERKNQLTQQLATRFGIPYAVARAELEAEEFDYYAAAANIKQARKDGRI